MDRKKHQLVLVADPQVLGALPKVCLSPPCPSRRPQPYLYLGKKQMEKKTDPGHSGCPHVTVASVIYSSLPPSTLCPEGKPCISTEPASSPTKQHLGLVDTGNVLICYKLELDCTGTRPGPFPGEGWGMFLPLAPPSQLFPQCSCREWDVLHPVLLFPPPCAFIVWAFR